jgi:hypothetical protein
MPRPALLRLHLVASLTALLTITFFLVSSAIVEGLGNDADIHSLKRWILRGLVVLVPALAAAGLSGRKLAGRSRASIVRRKQRRLQLVAATGVMLLIPCAITLERLAARRDLGLAFQLVQTLEFLAGTLNLTLLMLNFRDGLALRTARHGKRHVRSERAATAPTR